MSIYIKTNLVTFALFLLAGVANGKIINIGDLGLKANSQQNAVPFFEKALQIARQYQNAVILFPKGVYNFSPSFKPGYSDTTYTINKISGIKNLTIDGGGSEFIIHGKTIPFSIENCQNITLKNFAIDYQRPLITQGEFQLVSDTAIHLKIDKSQYPYQIADQKVWYLGEGWRSDHCYYNQVFDPHTGDIVPQTHDDPTGDFYKHPAKEIAPGIISFKGPFNWLFKPKARQIITMYNYIYAANTFQFSDCSGVAVKNITVYHGGSLCMYATSTYNIDIDSLNIVARKSKKRLFSNIADGIHLKGCGGKITIKNCTYNGGGDDFINVHNMYGIVEQKITDKKLQIKSFKGLHFAPNDTLWHIDIKNGQRIATNQVTAIRLISGTNWNGLFEFDLKIKVPETLIAGDLIESAKWIPDVLIKNNRILKRNRGSGIRVTTPYKAVIENNYFNTAGHAILIEGDLTGWRESGALNNLVIRNNTFDNCLTSGSVTGGRWEWGEAVIDIVPSVKPQSTDDKAFHHNITISDNRFICFDYPVLRARSVDTLNFINNKLIRSYIQKPYTVVKANFLLEGCHHVKITENVFSKNFLGKNISTSFMQQQDIQLDGKKGLTVSADAYKFLKKLEW